MSGASCTCAWFCRCLKPLPGSVEVFKDVLGGTAASHTCRCGGRHVLASKPYSQLHAGRNFQNVVFSRDLELAVWLYVPGGRYLTVFFAAWSTSSGVISTIARDSTAPLALTANERAAASTLLGRSTMITKSLLPKA